MKMLLLFCQLLKTMHLTIIKAQRDNKRKHKRKFSLKISKYNKGGDFTHKISLQFPHFLLVASHSVAVHSSTLRWYLSDFQIHLFKLEGREKALFKPCAYSVFDKHLELKAFSSKFSF